MSKEAKTELGGLMWVTPVSFQTSCRATASRAELATFLKRFMEDQQQIKHNLVPGT